MDDLVSSENKQEEHENQYYPAVAISPVSSNLSWDLECDIASSSSSGHVHFEDLADGIQWHRLSGDSWTENVPFQWPHLSDSVVSVPSSFQFNPKADIDYKLVEEDPNKEGFEELIESAPIRRSISESYISHHDRLSPPSKDFYHLVPIPLSNRTHPGSASGPRRQRHVPGNRSCPRRCEPAFTFDHPRLHGDLCRKRSLSLPLLQESSSLKETLIFEERSIDNSLAKPKRKSPSPRR